MQMAYMSVWFVSTTLYNPRHVWKHYRTQHLYIHTHIFKAKGCKNGKHDKPYGNDEQHTVWAHMGIAHKVPNPMSCPKCKIVEGFSSKKRQRDHTPNCEELEEKSTKNFGYDFVGCGKRYKTQQALNTHTAETHNPDKIEEQAELQFICEHCAQDFATKGSLTWHIKGNTRTSELMYNMNL